MTSIYHELTTKLRDFSANITVLGLGYVGLPLATVFAEAGYNVIGIDPDDRKIDQLNKGISYIKDVKEEQLSRLVSSGKLRGTTDFSVLSKADAVSICVPTPLRKTGDPDLSFILSVTGDLSRFIHPGMVVVLESTTYPGTTREILLPKLGEENDLKVGEDFFLGFSPERVDPGREDWTTINTPKVIGGITEKCTEVASIWYGNALQSVVPVTSSEVAEMAKLLENTFRMINIGLVNEMALMCDRLGIDIWEVIDAAATKPFGFMKFKPGPGLGGHCIPIDPLYLSWRLRALNYTARFIELASEINLGMPRHVIGLIQDGLNEYEKAIKGSKILIIGVAYKPDIDDIRESPALDIIGLLKRKGADVVYHDPYIPQLIVEETFEMECVIDLNGAVSDADCVVIVTNHSNYDYEAILAASKCIVDTRNALGQLGRNNPKVFRL
jgi:UDP-N-acetyl-D-glucosamine dehydrogenase